MPAMSMPTPWPGTSAIGNRPRWWCSAGASSMFLLTATLYWLAFGTLALVTARRSVWLGLATVLLAFTPPAFFFVGMIWRDVLFAVTWLAAAVLAFAAADRPARLRAPVQALALQAS